MILKQIAIAIDRTNDNTKVRVGASSSRIINVYLRVLAVCDTFVYGFVSENQLIMPY